MGRPEPGMEEIQGSNSFQGIRKGWEYLC